MSELLQYLSENEPQFRRTRLEDLYSDFSSTRSINPDGYAANISAWLSALSHAALAGCMPSPRLAHDILSITIDNDLILHLESREYGRPSALGTVVREGMKTTQWIDKEEFMNAKESVYKKRWSVPVPGVGDVLWWGLGLLGFTGDAGKVTKGEVVIMENLEAAGAAAAVRIEAARGKVDRIFERMVFFEAYRDIMGEETPLSDADMRILMRFLEREKGLLSYDRETVKLKAPNEKTPSPVTTEDVTIAHLKALIGDLESQTELLTKRIEDLSIAAKNSVARKNRASALAALKSKKLAETTLVKRHATLGQLEETFAKIEQASDQVELVKVMEASTRVLSGLNKEVGGIDRVDDVVGQLQEQIAQVDEVGNVLTEAGAANASDELEVDDELEAMEREERERKEAIERAERDQKEKKEAAETKRKLDALEEVEREAKAAAAKIPSDEVKQAAEASTEKGLEDKLKRLSVDVDKEAQPA